MISTQQSLSWRTNCHITVVFVLCFQTVGWDRASCL